jgi:hypothetical protein
MRANAGAGAHQTQCSRVANAAQDPHWRTDTDRRGVQLGAPIGISFDTCEGARGRAVACQRMRQWFRAIGLDYRAHVVAHGR